MEHVYWNPTMETMPREQLRALQDERLRDVVRRVYEHVPFYRNKMQPVSYTHLRAHETGRNLVCRLLLEKKKKKNKKDSNRKTILVSKQQ